MKAAPIPSSAGHRAVSLRNRQRTRSIDLQLLRQIVHHLLVELLAIPHFDLTIALVKDAEMTRLNMTHLRHAGSTDVITLDYSESGLLAGEIFVCVDEALIQAGRFHASWQMELVRYIVHGVLHLQGYDDLRAAARSRMKREENRRLRKLAGEFDLSKLSRKSKLNA
jgi:rRNA maturation RNase YbeY